MYEDLLRLDPLAAREETGGKANVQPAWIARTAVAVDPLQKSAATIGSLARLSREASAGGNLKLAGSLIDMARQSPIVQSSPAAAAFFELASLDISQKRGDASDAVARLSEMVRSGGAAGRPSDEEKEVAALGALRLAEWVAQDTEQLDGSAPVAEEEAPLALLLRATELAPEMAPAWAGLSNWLHAQCSELPQEVCRSLMLSGALAAWSQVKRRQH